MATIAADTDELSHELTALIRRVPGVTAVFSTKPVVATIVTTVVERVKHEPVGSRLVSVVHNDAGIDVFATIGVSGDEPARDVCTRVYDALREHLDGQEGMLASMIGVKVGRVG